MKKKTQKNIGVHLCPSVATTILSALLVLVWCGVSWAQPPQRSNGDTSAEAANIMREWEQLHKKQKNNEAGAPEKAIAIYQEFYEARGFNSGEASVEITSRIAQLYWRGLGRKDKAREIYDWGVNEFSRHPGVQRLKRERESLNRPGPEAAKPVYPSEWKAFAKRIAPPTVQPKAVTNTETTTKANAPDAVNPK